MVDTLDADRGKKKELSGAGMPPHTIPAESDFANVELGITRFFGFMDLGSNGLTFGWAAPEEMHAWSDGCQTIMNIEVEYTGEPYTIDFSGAPFLAAACQQQDIMTHVNGFYVGYWRLNSTEAYVLSAKIAPEQMMHRGGKAHLCVSWTFPNSISPNALGLSSDGRELGFCFRSLMIQKANANIPANTSGSRE